MEEAHEKAQEEEEEDEGTFQVALKLPGFVIQMDPCQYYLASLGSMITVKPIFVKPSNKTLFFFFSSNILIMTVVFNISAYCPILAGDPEHLGVFLWLGRLDPSLYSRYPACR